jgi:hypothetical protein
VTPELVERTGPIDTILAHVDLDGLYAAAKWIRGGAEPYPGADDDARKVDTRTGDPSATARVIDHALRARFRDEARKDGGAVYAAPLDAFGCDEHVLAVESEDAEDFAAFQPKGCAKGCHGFLCGLDGRVGLPAVLLVAVEKAGDRGDQDRGLRPDAADLPQGFHGCVENGRQTREFLSRLLACSIFCLSWDSCISHIS